MKHVQVTCSMKTKKCLVFCHSFALSELFGNQSSITIIFFTVYWFIHVGLIYCFFQIVLVCNFWQVFSVECSEILNFLSQLSGALWQVWFIQASLFTKHTGHKRYKTYIWHSTYMYLKSLAPIEIELLL